MYLIVFKLTTYTYTTLPWCVVMMKDVKNIMHSSNEQIYCNYQLKKYEKGWFICFSKGD